MESVWTFRLGLNFLMKSISNTKQSNLPCGHFHENACRLPNFCVQQHVEKGVGLYSRHNLRRTDHRQNDKQRIAGQISLTSPHERSCGDWSFDQV